MRNYSIELETTVNNKDYYINRVASSVDLDISKKLKHIVDIKADLENNYNVGLIIGNSGSGKTTFAKKVFGESSLITNCNEDLPLINQFNDSYSYDERVKILSSVGLNSIPSWIKPLKILSNGERARAEIAIRLQDKELICIDEFTSVVDRTVAKIMSYSIQKYARKENKKIICISVHNDIIEWLNPDWIIDMNTQEYIDRRLLWQKYKRKERIEFTIREARRESWKYFSKYHYLNANLPGGKIFLYGLFIKDKQIGFDCFANYVAGKTNILHFNRLVIDPEYTGIGLGVKFNNIVSDIMSKKGYTIRGKFSNKAMHISMKTDSKWKFLGANNNFGKGQYKGFSIPKSKNKAQRKGIITYQYIYTG